MSSPRAAPMGSEFTYGSIRQIVQIVSRNSVAATSYFNGEELNCFTSSSKVLGCAGPGYFYYFTFVNFLARYFFLATLLLIPFMILTYFGDSLPPQAHGYGLIKILNFSFANLGVKDVDLVTTAYDSEYRLAGFPGSWSDVKLRDITAYLGLYLALVFWILFVVLLKFRWWTLKALEKGQSERFSTPSNFACLISSLPPNIPGLSIAAYERDLTKHLHIIAHALDFALSGTLWKSSSHLKLEDGSEAQNNSIAGSDVLFVNELDAQNVKPGAFASELNSDDALSLISSENSQLNISPDNSRGLDQKKSDNSRDVSNMSEPLSARSE